MTLPAVSETSLLLRGLVLGLALSLRGKDLAPNGFYQIKFRELALRAVSNHGEVMGLLRKLWRLGPETYVKRELASLKGDAQ